MDKTSFRQVGTRPSGSRKPKPRTTNGQRKVRTIASIPSKFETDLNTGANERDAFGTRTYRFKASANELPGPGMYYKPASMVKEAYDCGSVSKLGYGSGFVSKSKRFADEDDYDISPGPGQYNYTALERKSYNKVCGSSAFAPAVKKTKEVKTAALKTPGPGQYDIAKVSSKKKSAAGSAFRSQCARGFSPTAEGPAPGQYNNPLQMGGRSKRKGQAIFKSAVARGEQYGSAGPGPGAYDHEEADRNVRYDAVAQARGSSMFSTGAVDRFGRRVNLTKVAEILPGPGAYTPATFDGQSAASSSVFRSKTQKGAVFGSQNRVAKPPGPAYYFPHNIDKRSYMLNATRKWV